MPEVKPASAPNYATQMSWTVSRVLAAGAAPPGSASYTLYLGTAHEPGLRLRTVTVTTNAGVARSAADYFFFRPFVAYTVNGAATKRYLSAGLGADTLGITADVPFRIHSEEFLNERLGKGWRVGVDITTVCTNNGQPAETFINLNAGIVRYVG